MNPLAALAQARLYGIFDCAYAEPTRLESVLEQMIAGGVDIIQLRAKTLTPSKIAELAKRAITLLKESGVPFIINDYPQIAADIGADGFHVGQDDGDLPALRVQHPGLIIGRSTHSPAQAAKAAAQQADYIGFGPLYPTPTKQGRPAIGLTEVPEAHKKFSGPVFCIGGIKLHNLSEVIRAGASRVVVVSGILTSTDIVSTCRELRRTLDQTPLS